jgi:HEPN domain-containing protein
MCDRSAASLLVKAAERDAAALAAMLDANAFAVEVFGFHAQQVAEKSLKAWLAILDIEYPRTHNLRSLMALIERAGADVSGLSSLIALSAFAVQFRYDAYDLTDESLDRAAVLQEVQALLARVRALLDERRPAG